MKKILLATAALAAPLTASPVPINKIAAIVNGKTITTREVQAHLAPSANLLLTKYPRRGEQFIKALTEARDKVLEQLIEDELVLSKLEDLDANIPDHLVKQEIDRIVHENFNGKESDFRRYLKKNNVTRRDFEKTQKEKILVQVFRQQQFKDVAPATNAEIKTRYRKRAQELRDRSKDKITFRKIYIPAADNDNPAATPLEQLALAEKLFTRVKGGEDFAQVAAKHSAGAFAQQGGLWEDTLRTDLEVGFGDIAFEAPNGQIVGPLKDRIGFTIVKVVKKVHGPAPDFDKEMRERMRTEVEIEKRSGRYEEWIELLKRTAMIKRKI
jgi:peptidyl-prolyl cis-trans isomerase SurA